MIGVGLSIVQLAVRQLLGFDPKSLFAASEQGVWYDPSDMSTCFQDSSGTTPVTAVEQPVGLILDKSKGLVLGPELVTNGTFDSGTTGWIAGPAGSAVTLSVVNQRLRLTKTSTAAFGSAVQQITGLSATNFYKFSVNGYVGTAQVRVLIGGVPEVGSVYGGSQSATDISPTVYVTGVTSFWITVLAYGGNGTYAEFDNISVRELPGNHATQTTATSRPVLSARYNLLTKTEQFDDAVWVKSNVTVTPNAAIAPDGTLTADAIFETATTGSHFLRGGNNIPGPVNGTCTGRIRIKANGRNKVQVFVERAGAAEWAGCTFNLSNNTYNSTPITSGGASFVSAAIADDADGFKIITVTGTPSVGSFLTNFIVCLLDDAASETVIAPSYAGDTSKGIYIWGASLVQANQASLPYQRVNTATDYDADPSKFKPYLRFDGVDDWLVTPTITPGTDKAQVFAGVRKLNTSTSLLVESSSDISANNGTFVVNSPASTGFTRFASKGTTLQFVDGSDVSPNTAVLTGLGDISGDSAILRVNGTQAASSTADQGTGNYLAYPLYIGRRGGNTLPFNGHLYGLIVRFGANLPAGTIASTETWLNQRTGAY